MPTPPFLDDHSRLVAAPAERTWSALLAVVAGLGRELPGPLLTAWGLDRSGRTGDWTAPAPGDTITGFEVAEVDPPRLLVLRGRHRFSRYELWFLLEPSGGGVDLHARSYAVFPGPLGFVYRTLVVGTRGHVLAVRRLLARIAARAES